MELLTRREKKVKLKRRLIRKHHRKWFAPNQTFIISNPSSIVHLDKSPGANAILTYWKGIFQWNTENGSRQEHVRSKVLSLVCTTRGNICCTADRFIAKREKENAAHELYLSLSLPGTHSKRETICVPFRAWKKGSERRTHTGGYKHHLIMARIARN